MNTNQPKPDGRTKPEEQRASSQIQLRVTHSRKAAYVREANRNNTTLAGWMFRVCDREARYEATPRP